MPDIKEYIERGALIARLEASPLFQNFGEDGRFILAGVVELLEILPAADVVEVVRCEKCKFYEIVEYWHPDCNGTKQVCRLLKRQMQEDDFCSYGERKDGADNAAD